MPSEKFSEKDLKKPHSSVLAFEKQSLQKFWVRKNKEVFKENFNNLWVLSRLFVFDDWKDIAKFLEELYKVKINLLFADKALIKVTQGNIED